MDLLANDITVILSLLAAVLGVIGAVSPFLKNPEKSTTVYFFKKSVGITERDFFKKFGFMQMCITLDNIKKL